MSDIFRPAILYVDDEEVNLRTFARAFGGEYLVKTCLSAEEALKILEKEDFPLIIADQRMPGMTGIALCERLIDLKPQSTRIILTAYTETNLLLDAIHRGRVHDYIVKPWRKSELKPILDRAFEDYRARMAKLKELEAKTSEMRQLREEIGHLYNEGLVGAALGLQSVMGLIQKVAPTDTTVLLSGETGTGKELLARAVHAQSPRRDGPFVAVHCAAMATNLIESELFGHERGAFTGAEATRLGRFESARGGTLFLDEVGEIPLEVQVKLLRVLQERRVQRVGGSQDLPVDVRIVTATHRDLKADVASGRFRQDLFFRLSVFPIVVPPLRDRPQDIEPLADFFIKKFSRQFSKPLRLSSAALDLLRRYDWPGNVRELQNIVERAAILSEGGEISPEEIGPHLDEFQKIETIDLDSTAKPVRDVIRKEEILSLTQALRAAGGNISEAARALGIARSTLFHRLRKNGLI